MIILDLNNVLFSAVLKDLNKTSEINVDLFRHIALNSIRALNAKFRAEYGEMVFAVDSFNYWRKSQFPYYKASRKKAREKSELNWNKIFECLDSLKKDLQEVFPYKYIRIDTAEADDIIAVACKYTNKSVLIISTDKDYLQLQTNTLVKQYDPVKMIMVKTDDPKSYLLEHIIRGDSNDGVPNIASPDNCFVIGQRQNRITSKMLDSYKNIENQPEHSLYRNYMRNKMLIDLTQIPSEIEQQIIFELNKENTKNRSKILNYLVKNKMSNLLENINDF
jgi:hypothetical protein